jgi:hypothetical protein
VSNPTYPTVSFSVFRTSPLTPFEPISFSTIANMESLETTFMADFPSSSALAPVSTQAQPASSGLESTRAATAVALHQAKQSSYSTTNGAFSSFAPVSSLLLIALAISTFATLQ